MKSYKELEVWIKCKELVVEIYKLTRNFSSEEKFGLVSQMRRSAVSAPSNIAEGQGRNHSKDTLQFLYIARGSLYELETQTIISLDLEYLKVEDFESLAIKINECLKLLNGFIRYIESKI